MSGLDADLPEGGDLPAGDDQQGEHQETDYEAMARPEGWKPKDQYRGNPEDWVDAETFVKRGREINPILRKNNERLQRELDGIRSELKEATHAVRSLQEYNANLEKKAYERALKSLRAEKRQAIAAGDHETAAELDEQLEELRDSPPTPAKPAEAKPDTPQKDPVLVAWMEENASWFNDENPEMVDYANAVGMRLRRSDPQMQRYKGQSFLDEIKRAVTKQFPDKFGRRSGGPSLVEPGSGPSSASGGRGGGKTLASLPADAKAAYRQLASEKWYQDLAKSQKLTTEQLYMRDYGEE